MTIKTSKANPIEQVFAHLLDDGSILSVPVTDDFWTTQVANLPVGRLVSVMDSDKDWTSWEMHPHGDEFILLLSGALTLILDDMGSEQRVKLYEGEHMIIPKGIWHTADVLKPARALFITPGEETEHKPRTALRASF